MRRVSQALAATPGVVVKEVGVGNGQADLRACGSRHAPLWLRPATHAFEKVAEQPAESDNQVASQIQETLILPRAGHDIFCASCQHHVEAALRATEREWNRFASI